MAHADVQTLHGTDLVGWTPLQVAVVAICALINALDGMDVLIISFIAPAMSDDWGLSVETLGMIFSIGLAGMMAGCVLVAPLADRFGRRPTIIAALLMLTAGTIGTGLAGSLGAFVACRALTGIGIGTLLASIAALVSEYAPAGKRSFAIGIFQAGYPLGAILTGLTAIWAIPTYGWQATLVGAGVISAVVLPAVILWLPESINFLESRQPANALARINALRSRLGLDVRDALPGRIARADRSPIAALFADGMWASTVLLWLSTFASFGVLYFVTSWIPKLSIEAGLDADKALWAGSIFNMGGLCGAFAIGWLATRFDIGRLIRAYLLIGGLLLVAFAAPLPLPLTLLMAGLIGITIQGGFTGYYSLAAQMYPPAVRSSGIGWAIGIGRGGSVIGPLAGGFLLAAKLPLWLVFLCFAAPLAVAGILAAMVRHRRDLA